MVISNSFEVWGGKSSLLTPYGQWGRFRPPGLAFLRLSLLHKVCNQFANHIAHFEIPRYADHLELSVLGIGQIDVDTLHSESMTHLSICVKKKVMFFQSFFNLFSGVEQAAAGSGAAAIEQQPGSDNLILGVGNGTHSHPLSQKRKPVLESRNRAPCPRTHYLYPTRTKNKISIRNSQWDKASDSCDLKIEFGIEWSV